MVRDFAELERFKDQVKGRIVLFDEPFDHNLADNNSAGTAYGYAGRYRFQGTCQGGQARRRSGAGALGG